MKKVSIIGAGNVGGTTALRIAREELANIVLVDVNENLARAKAEDILDARFALGKDCRIEATADFSKISNSEVIVVTAGFPRKPGMTREELLLKNAGIVGEVCKAIVDFGRGAIVVIVSNPLDAMTYLALKATGLPKSKIFGMGPSLDTSRFANLISRKLFVGTDDVETLVIGSHGETMLPLARLSYVRGKPLSELLSEEDVQILIKGTKQRGAEIVSLYGSGSAYIAPSAAIFQIVETIITGHIKDIPVSAYLEGEYGLSDVCIGVPARIDSQGIEQIVEIELTSEEKDSLQSSAQAIEESIKLLKI